MRKLEISETHYEWLNLSLEDKYKDALEAYFEKFPTGSISDFHLMEIEHWENRLKQYDEVKNREWWETKFIVEGQKMLAYYENLETNNVKENTKEVDITIPTNLTFLLQLYYEKGCKVLNKQQVEKLAEEKKLSLTSLIKLCTRLANDGYKPKANKLSIKEFLKSYKTLMNTFENSDPKSFEAVKNHYNQLKETYPDLTY